MRGQRFHINLDSDEELDDVRADQSIQPTGLNLSLVGDIKERVSSRGPITPSPPRIQSSQTGFPAHKTRTGSSVFKNRREHQYKGNRQLDKHPAGGPDENGVSSVRNGSGATFEFKYSNIDQENRQRLALMSDHEIEEARRELMAGLNPSLIEKLLKKANIDEDQTDPAPEGQTREESVKENSSEEPNQLTPRQEEHAISTSFNQEDPPLHPPPGLRPAVSREPLSLIPDIHFPKLPKPPDLHPSDPNFLEALHSNYFPSLPADPSTLAWMTPVDPNAGDQLLYSPSQQSVTPSAIRFDFRGRLVPPRLSSQIPTTKGLHHHGHAPSSAGYTIPELAHLARSTYPAQRCIAYQTLGRILYRLGRGDFGLEGNDLYEGLWHLMDEGKVVEDLVAVAGKGEMGGNRSVWVTATDAVWLWRKGGGRRWKGR